jgi:hypothetical protein
MIGQVDRQADGTLGYWIIPSGWNHVQQRLKQVFANHDR